MSRKIFAYVTRTKKFLDISFYIAYNIQNQQTTKENLNYVKEKAYG